MASTPLEEIYEVLLDKLKGIKDTFWIDIDRDQLDTSGETMPIKFPAILLKFSDVMWREYQSYQMGVVCVSVKLVFQFKSEGQWLAMNAAKNEVSTCLNYLDEIHVALDKQHGSSFSELRRFNQYQVQTNPKDLLWVHVIQYMCNIQSNGNIDNPNNLDIAYDDIQNTNAFLERHRFNLLHK